MPNAKNQRNKNNIPGKTTIHLLLMARAHHPTVFKWLSRNRRVYISTAVKTPNYTTIRATIMVGNEISERCFEIAPQKNAGKQNSNQIPVLQYISPCHSALFQTNSALLYCLAVSFFCYSCSAWGVSLALRSDPSSTPTEGIFTIGWQDFPIQRIFKPSAMYNNLTRGSKYSSALSLFNMTCTVQNHLSTTGSCALLFVHLSRAPSSPTEFRQTLHMCSHHSSLLPTSQATLARPWLGCFQSCLDG